MQKFVNKHDWIAMFQEIGLSEEGMKKWHQLFETRHPDGHESFLSWLGISSEESTSIRTQSR